MGALGLAQQGQRFAAFPLGLKSSPIRDLEDGIARLRTLLDGGSVDGPGEPLSLSFKPQPPPLFVAASQPRMLRLAGRCADGVIVMGPSDPEMVAMQLAHVDAGAREAGRDPRDVFRDLWVTMAVGDGPDAVHAVKSWASAQARWLARWKDVPPSLDRFRTEITLAAETYDFGKHLSVSAAHAGGISNEFALALAVAGPVEECRRRLTGLVAHGVDRVSVSLLSGGRQDRLDALVDVWGGVAANETA